MARGVRYSIKALGGRLGEQWERDRRDTLFLMAATLLTALVHFPFVPVWASIGFALLFVWRLGLVLSGRALPSAPIRWLAATACLVAVWVQYETFIGRDVGVTILLLFLGLKLLEMRARRDLFVVLFLCFFLLLTVFFEDQSLPIALAVTLAVVALVTTMVTMQFGDQEAPIGKRFRLAGGLLLQALPIAALLFVLFPRLQQPLWSMPEDKIRARMGLSESMRPGSISELTLSTEIAFRVVFPDGAPPPSQMYWRGPVLGAFDGRAWRAAPMRPSARQADLEHAGADTGIRYTVTLEPQEQDWLYALEAPVQVQGLPVAARLDAQMLLHGPSPNGSRLRYDVVSQPRFTLGRHEPAQSLAALRALPDGFNPRARALAERWRDELPTPRQRIDRVLAWFGQAPFRYTLSPPVWGTHGIDEFLFDTGAGFCEHYASATTFLLRAMDIPARIVTGYQGGEPNPVNGSWLVRQGDAHAWVEAWLDDQGWVRVDPVNAIAPERIEPGSRGAWTDEAAPVLAGGQRLWQLLSLNLDAMANAWNQWVLSYDGATQQRLLARLGLDGVLGDWRELAGLLAAAMGVLIGAAALVTLHPRHPRDPIERWYREFCERLAVVGLDKLPHETAGQHLERIGPGLGTGAQLDARRIVASYNSLRFGDPDNRLPAAHPSGLPDRRRHRRADMRLGIRRFRRLVRRFHP
ncbi:MAG: DUF3488 and transglutaminase-like domain-containing protein [Burkholderiaceae bacterium]